MITIIELKKGKIKQTKICEDCASKHIQSLSIMTDLPEEPKDILDLFLNYESDQECSSCLTLNVEEDKMSPEQRIKILESKMAAAVKVEDYESAAMIKKQIEKIRNSN